MTTTHPVVDRIAHLRVVPVVVIDNATSAPLLAKALDQAGLPCAEVTFRTPAAADAIRAMSETANLVLGAGTVLTPDQVDAAIAAGATYIVTPGFSRAVVKHCQDRGIPVFPGIATPAELQAAYEADVRIVKFFPAEALGGLSTLKAIAAPFAMMRFIPTGGINANNAADYLDHPAVLAVGGSWMVAPALIDAGEFDTIARLAAIAVGTAGSTATPQGATQP
jgi:2-dehydro-3-deoxyphosphogluconate aldolase/(4S)-4-hydroxy-2-oxoglutarate aldolase